MNDVMIAFGIDRLDAVQHLEVVIHVNAAGLPDSVFESLHEYRQRVIAWLVRQTKQPDLVGGDLITESQPRHFDFHPLRAERSRYVIEVLFPALPRQCSQ